MVLRQTENYCILGPQGCGKTTTAAYLTFNLLRLHPWIETIVSNTPIFEGDPFSGIDIETLDGTPKLHSKFRPLHSLREDLPELHDCVLFLDEVGNLIPARQFKEQRQWVVLKLAKDTRKQNCFVIATDQYWRSFDVQLRENMHNIIQPLLDLKNDSLMWNWYKSDGDPNFSNYVNKVGAIMFPNSESTEDFPPMPPSILQRYFDSSHKIKVAFNEPMSEDILNRETRDFARVVLDEDRYGFKRQYYDLRRDVPIGLLERALKEWTNIKQKYYFGDELNSILLRYLSMAPNSHAHIKKPTVKCADCPDRDPMSEYNWERHSKKTGHKELWRK